MDILGIIIGLGIVFLFTGIYILVSLGNRKTKVPEGCEFAYLEANCGACLSKTCEKTKEKKVTI
ncbi:MAG: hypothetical protein ACOX56_06590 [Acholeplasmataceae bacterium]|jgi:hypothetical protein